MASYIDSTRLAEALTKSGQSQSSVARAAGITPGAISQLINGTARQSRHLSAIARALNVSEDWLLGTTTHPGPLAGRLLPVPMWALGGNHTDDWGDPRMVSVDLQLLDLPATGNAGIFTNVGTAMSPTINDNDRVVVDFDQNDIDRPNALWMVGVGGFSMFRRILPLGANLHRLMTDSGTETPVELSRDALVVTGRVISISKSQ